MNELFHAHLVFAQAHVYRLLELMELEGSDLVELYQTYAFLLAALEEDFAVDMRGPVDLSDLET